MHRYPITEQTTVGEFLRQSGLQPPFSDPDSRLPALIECEGIIHETRSGEIFGPVDAEDYEVLEGDFLVVHEECPSGESQTITMDPQASDFAFIMGSDSFYNNASAYLSRRPSTIVVPRGNINSLEEILQTVINGSQITMPIRNIIIVSHAAEELLSFRLTDDASETRIYPDLICPYVSNTERPQITDRQISSSNSIYIHGCNIGKHEQFLRFIKDIFGGECTVTAPKHIDFFGGFNYSGRRGRFEYMLYHYTVITRERVSSKDELVGLFRDKYELETDINGTLITEANWTDWLPAESALHPSGSGTRTSSSHRHDCSSPVDSQMHVSREYRYTAQDPYRFNLSSWDQPGTDPPEDESEILDNLRTVMEGLDEMQTNYPSSDCQYPYYTRWGYDSFDDFFDAMHWSTRWNASTRIMVCTAMRHRYELRIPISDDQNSLMINAILNTGDREYMPDCHDLEETNPDFFASV